MDEQAYLTVSDLNEYLRRKFDLDPYLAKVYLTGEISNFRLRPKHQYFSLKDEQTKISAVMFDRAFSKLQFKPEEGMKVRVVGRVTMYPASGQYQIVIEQMEPDGVGALYQAFVQLKNKLSAEGLFDRNQRPLSRFPKRIAVVTSPSGAVIHDIMTTVARRYPIAQVTLFPAQVQGTTAADSIVAALSQVLNFGPFDALIIGRGGGSIEDLWPFNEEKVARALVAMPMPVISSVGHETDTTITDFVADQRAATPTAAAELATPIPLTDVLVGIGQLANRATVAMQNRLKNARLQLERIKSRPAMQQPQRLYDQYNQTVDQWTQRLVNVNANRLKQTEERLQQARLRLAQNPLKQRLSANEQSVMNARQRLTRAMAGKLQQATARVEQASAAIEHLGPDQILGRGYAYIQDEQGKILRDTTDFKVNQTVTIRLHDGRVQTRVLAKEENDG